MKDALRQLLLANETRQTISSLLPPGVSCAAASDHSAWRNTHFHIHHHREALLTLSGTAAQSLDGKVYQTQPGTLLLIDRNERHDSGYCPGNCIGQHLWFMIHDDFLNCIHDEVDEKGNFRIRQRYLFSSIELIPKLNYIWDQHNKLHAAIILKEIVVILELICCEIVWNKSLSANKLDTISDSQHKLTKVIEQYIQKNHGVNSSIKQLAAMSGYSAIHLMRIFKSHTGIRIHEYVDNCRKKHYQHCQRRNLLRKEIADELGFSSTASLAHWCQRNQLKSGK